MKTLLTISLIHLAFFSFAQEKEKYASRSKPKKEVTNVANYNAIKFDPLRLAIGEINFSWEPRVGERASLEFEFGPTVSNLKGLLDLSRFTSSSYLVDYESKAGVLLSGAVRFYPLDNRSALNGFYISPRIKYRQFNEVSRIASEEFVLADQQGFTKEFIFSFNMGFQEWVSNNFGFDYYLGIGIGTYNKEEFTAVPTYISDPNSYYYTNQIESVAWKKNTDKYARIVGVMGLKFSIGY